MNKKKVDLRDHEALLLEAFQDSSVGISIRYVSDRRLKINPALERMLGYRQAELENLNIAAITHPDDREDARALMRDLGAGIVERGQRRKRMIHKSGAVLWVLSEGWACRDDDGSVRYYFFIYQDITQAKLAEDRVLAQSALLSSTVDAIAQGLVVFDREGRLALWNRNYEKMFRFPDGFLARGLGYAEITRVRLALEGYSPEHIERTVQRRLAHAQRHENRSGEGMAPSGLAFLYNRRAMPDGGYLDTFTDLTNIRRLESETAEKTEILEATFAHMAEGIVVFAPDGALRTCNKEFERILDLPAGMTLSGMRDRDVLGHFAEKGFFGPGDVSEVVSGVSKAIAKQEKFSIEMRSPAGFIYRCSCAPMPEGGRIHSITDITEQRRAEEKLQHAQKMESIGQLTGGVAHDFNNLLAVMLGNVELIKDMVKDRQDLLPMLDVVEKAGRHGAALTQQLLAFSRRQVLQPKAVDIAQQIREMAALLGSSLGETIVIDTKIGEGRCFAKVDPGVFANAILNLAVNARDAMPQGGRLEIEVSIADVGQSIVAAPDDLAFGAYVRIDVSDTGSGMTAEVAARAIEPFFTTKDVGEGSGLGLSMVDGFIRQSGGSLMIRSDPDRGTRISLFLPVVIVDSVAPSVENPGPTLDGRGESILVVEDNADVRKVTVGILEQMGYVVTSAANAVEALGLLDAHGAPDLWFSDVVLPGGMNGIEAAEKARAKFPDLKVLFTSGYPEDVVARQHHLKDGIDILNKPFGRKVLSEKIRKTLG